jgi:glycosyltransferase involved in cell wall biosynthesis
MALSQRLAKEPMNRQQPVLSIVVPSYNSGPLLSRCLASFGGAHGGRTEVIVVDNDSRDQTAEVVAAHGEIVTTFISEPDRGQSDALNKGFATARGKYVCWMNADDEFVTGAVSRLVSDLEHAEGDWYTAGMIWIDGESRVTKCSPAMPFWFPLPQAGMTGVGGPSSIVRREVAAEAGAFDESLHYCMDTEMWLRLHAKGVTMTRLPYYVWAFRVHALSKTSHVHLSGKANASMTAERSQIASRFGLPHGKAAELVAAVGTRWVGAVSGRDFRAFLDTARYRGKPLADVVP